MSGLSQLRVTEHFGILFCFQNSTANAIFPIEPIGLPCRPQKISTVSHRRSDKLPKDFILRRGVSKNFRMEKSCVSKSRQTVYWLFEKGPNQEVS